MMLHAVVLGAQIQRCAPQVAPRTMAAIVHVESGGDPLAIGDNTTARSYHPRERAGAEAIAGKLLAEGHSVDLGIAQIDDVNLAQLRLNVHTVFDACTNLAAAAQILSRDYARAVRRYGAGQMALRHAIGMYNTGRLDAGAAYVQRVLLAARITEGYDPSARVLAAREAMHARLLVQVPTDARTPSRAHDAIMPPDRAPILVRALPASQAMVFWPRAI